MSVATLAETRNMDDLQLFGGNPWPGRRESFSCQPTDISAPYEKVLRTFSAGLPLFSAVASGLQEMPHLMLARMDKNSYERCLLKERICELRELASNEDWDGEGAVPLNLTTVRHAVQFADCLPLNLPPPDVDVSPHGEIDFEWIFSRDAMLSVSLCPDGTIAFAVRLPEERTRSTAIWSGDVPISLDAAFKGLRSVLTT